MNPSNLLEVYALAVHRMRVLQATRTQVPRWTTDEEIASAEREVDALTELHLLPARPRPASAQVEGQQ